MTEFYDARRGIGLGTAERSGSGNTRSTRKYGGPYASLVFDLQVSTNSVEKASDIGTLGFRDSLRLKNSQCPSSDKEDVYRLPRPNGQYRKAVSCRGIGNSIKSRSAACSRS